MAVSTADKDKIFRQFRHSLGAPTRQIEMTDDQLCTLLEIAIEDYAQYVQEWLIEHQWQSLLGHNISTTDMAFALSVRTLDYVQQSTYAYSKQVGLQTNGPWELKKDYVSLEAGRQVYQIPAGREVNEVLWFTPSFVNLFGLDPFANTNIAFTEFGASFAGHTLYHVMPVFDTILTAQAAELRNRVRGSEYSYILKPGPNGTKRLRLLPIPYPTNPSSGANMGIGGGFGTPGTVFYYYYDKANYYGNPLYSGNTANPNFSGYSGSLSGNQGNGLVSSPADVQLNFITWNQLNSVAQRWVKRYSLALCKEILGLGIRGKFNGQLPIPGAELTLNKDDLINTGREDQSKLIEELNLQLAELSYEKILEKRALMQESINKTLGFGPMGISVF
jgi:hypothetical protein